MNKKQRNQKRRDQKKAKRQLQERLRHPKEKREKRESALEEFDRLNSKIEYEIHPDQRHGVWIPKENL